MAKKTSETTANLTIADLGVGNESKVDAMKPNSRPITEIKREEIRGERSKATIVVEEFH